MECGGEASASYSAQQEDLDGGQLARLHCGSCHQFPEPERLDKQTWRDRVLPHMAYRMGVKDPEHEIRFTMQEVQQLRQAGMYPLQPLVDSLTWRKIVDYYFQEAPDSLPSQKNKPAARLGLDQFAVKEVDLGLNNGALTCMLHWAPTQGLLYVGDGRNQLFRVNGSGEALDRFRFQSPPLSVHVDDKGGAYVLAVGHFHPNDEPLGQLCYLTPEGQVHPLIEGLPRSVDMAFADLDGDGQEDFILCGFGNYSGRLSWFRNLGNHQFEENILVNTPGAVKTYALDFNGDGRTDILTLLAQGDERILVHFNQGRGKFREERLLRFDPVFGSVYFEPVDFDADGDLDLLYVNGDNADYSFDLKPYHGIRLYRNDGNNRFEEAFFFPLYGAFKATAADFDADGDPDIAAIAFFPDFEKAPEESFVYLENVSDGKDGPVQFAPATFEASPRGRWITMESADFDGDGRQDIALGSFTFAPTATPDDLQQRWVEEGVNVLLLYNKGRVE
jgi:hypothetical protein